MSFADFHSSSNSFFEGEHAFVEKTGVSFSPRMPKRMKTTVAERGKKTVEQCFFLRDRSKRFEIMTRNLN